MEALRGSGTSNLLVLALWPLGVAYTSSAKHPARTSQIRRELTEAAQHKEQGGESFGK